MKKIDIPEKPETMEEKIDMIWKALFNDIPHQLAWQDNKISFVLTLMAITLAFSGIIATMLAILAVKLW